MSNENQAVVVIDQYITTIDPFFIKKISNKYNVLFLVVANVRKYVNRSCHVTLSLSDVDAKIESISECVLCVNRPTEISSEDNIFTIDVLKNSNGLLKTYEVNMSGLSMKINDVYEVDYLTYNDDLADDLPF